MRRLGAGHIVNALPVVFDFAQKEFPIQRRTMSMRVQLNIDPASRNLPNFIGSQNMQRSLRE